MVFVIVLILISVMAMVSVLVVDLVVVMTVIPMVRGGQKDELVLVGTKRLTMLRPQLSLSANQLTSWSLT